MPIPDFQTLMLPFLRVIEDGQEYSLKDLINQLADEFNLTDFERNLRSENSTNYVFRNKVGWAKDTFQLPMRNSNDSSRNPKYLLKIDSGPKKYILLIKNFNEDPEEFKEEFPEFT